MKGKRIFLFIYRPFCLYREVRTGGADKGGAVMRISSSNIDMYSSRTYSEESYEKVSIRKTSENVLVLTSMLENGQEETGETEEKQEAAETSEKGTTYIKTGKISTAQQKEDTKTIRQQCIQYLLEVLLINREKTLSGHSIRRVTYQDWLNEKQNQSMQTQPSVRTATKTTSQIIETTGYCEKESTTYETKGTVVTADGKSIEFNLSFAMSRSFETYYQEVVSETTKIAFCDPLVINLDSTMPEVSDQKFLFDLDQDGVMETISMLSNKSGYLAIDKNEDGMVNDGSELFGTQSGDGFKDLAEYDDDENGWIDEDDEIWNKLMIWCMDESGKSELYHISEKGVGAICLKNVSSDFSLNSLKTNQTNAAVRNTGIFLYENGNVGTVQHMDLAI